MSYAVRAKGLKKFSPYIASTIGGFCFIRCDNKYDVKCNAGRSFYNNPEKSILHYSAFMSNCSAGVSRLGIMSSCASFSSSAVVFASALALFLAATNGLSNGADDSTFGRVGNTCIVPPRS